MPNAARAVRSQSPAAVRVPSASGKFWSKAQASSGPVRRRRPPLQSKEISGIWGITSGKKGRLGTNAGPPGAVAEAFAGAKK